jgi:hypothetical protein
MHCCSVQERLPDEDLLDSVEWKVLWTVLVPLLSIQHSGLVREMMRWKRWSRRQVDEDSQEHLSRGSEAKRTNQIIGIYLQSQHLVVKAR